MGPGGYRNPMSESRSEEGGSEALLALIDRYFAMVASGDPEIATLFAEDAVWHTPASSPMPGPFVGRDAVLEVMSGGVGLYEAGSLEIRQTARAASREHVFVAMTMTARTAGGATYENHYVFVFTIRDGRIAEVHEHLDTLYAQRVLFDPLGQRSPLDDPPA